MPGNLIWNRRLLWDVYNVKLSVHQTPNPKTPNCREQKLSGILCRTLFIRGPSHLYHRYDDILECYGVVWQLNQSCPENKTNVIQLNIWLMQYTFPNRMAHFPKFGLSKTLTPKPCIISGFPLISRWYHHITGILFTICMQTYISIWTFYFNLIWKGQIYKNKSLPVKMPSHICPLLFYIIFNIADSVWEVYMLTAFRTM